MQLTPYAALHARIASRLTVLGCGVLTAGIGALTLAGYWVGVVWLYQWNPAAIGMAPNTALAFILSGVGLAIVGASNKVWRCT